MTMFKHSIAAIALMAAATLPAMAHVSLETASAKAGSNFKAVLRVPHGCDGATTIAIKVRVPEGVISVKPMPKAGWKRDKTVGEYAKAYDLHGEQQSNGVRELTWSGGHLGDDEYDEFVFRAFITDTFKPGQSLVFPVVQLCDGGATTRWIEVPADGKSADDYEHPAPALTIIGK